MTVSSRSSMYLRTYGSPIRAVTFQSMERTSSPKSYWRNSSKFMPRPLNTLWYWPAKAVSTKRRVRSSSLRIFFRISGTDCMNQILRDREPSEDSLNDRFARYFFSFGFITDNYSMPENIHSHRFYVLRRYVTSAIEERMSASSQGQVDRGSWRCAIADQTFHSQVVLF